MEQSDGDESRASDFLTLFDRVARNALACRRAHHWLDRNFTESPAMFTRLQREFVREVHQNMGGPVLHGAASLPGQMAWALLLLAGHNNLDDYIITTVFEAARRLHSDTLRLFVERDQAALAKRRLEVARKLVARLARIGPCKRRTLVRGLDQQGLHLHEPVIRVLVDHGVFTEDLAGLLALGRVPLKTLAAAKLIDNPQLP